MGECPWCNPSPHLHEIQEEEDWDPGFAMSKYNLVEVDTLDFLTIVNDEMDNISHSPNPAVKAGGSFMHIPLTDVQNPQAYGGAKKQMRMDNICCGAHGLSLMIV